MSGYTIAWLLWGAMFVAIEWPAIANKRKGGTLSEHVWRWGSVKDKGKWWRIRRLVLIVFLVWLTLHFLTGGEEGPIMSEMLQQLVTPLMTALAPVIAGLIVAALVQWLRKLGLELGAEQQAKLEMTVRNGVLSAEEWAARKAKQKAPVSAGEKLDHAVELIQDKLPKMSTPDAVALVDQELPKLKMGASAPFQPAPTKP